MAENRELNKCLISTMKPVGWERMAALFHQEVYAIELNVVA